MLLISSLVCFTLISSLAHIQFETSKTHCLAIMIIRQPTVKCITFRSCLFATQEDAHQVLKYKQTHLINRSRSVFQMRQSLSNGMVSDLTDFRRWCTNFFLFLINDIQFSRCVCVCVFFRVHSSSFTPAPRSSLLCSNFIFNPTWWKEISTQKLWPSTWN